MESEPIDTALLKEKLLEFLTFKYVLDNRELEKMLEEKFDDVNQKKPDWKNIFEDWPTIIGLLTSKETPTPYDYFPEDPKQSITIILPPDLSDKEQSFRFLKAAAYLPYQIDPIAYNDFGYDEDILTQLSFAAHNGYWNARYHLSRLDLRFPLLRGHPMCKNEAPFQNLHDNYYSISLPKKYWKPDKKGKKTLPFDPKNDKENLWKFFDYLVKIIQYGERPKGKKYEYINKKYINRKPEE